MRLSIGLIFSSCLMAQSLATVAVTAKPVDRFVPLTAELRPFQSVELVARIAGYLDRVDVDRGSVVKKGQQLASIQAPELASRLLEAQARVLSVQAQTAEARARLAAAQSTANRLKLASQTPGAVAANEVALAEESVRASQAAVDALVALKRSADANVLEVEDMRSFLQVKAPFDGVVSERSMHPGALVGPNLGPMLRMEQLSRLRVEVAVPEAFVSTVKPGQVVSFSVSAYPGETFKGSVARLSRVMDPKTRTMPVELEFANPGGRLSPGMYTEVKWPAKAGAVTMLVPATAVTSNTERSFVIRIEAGVARYVNVKKGPSQGELVEVSGPLAVGDLVIQRATDEIREGTRVPQSAR
jgi:membrane fusion protein (multidrug efflux system)